jgi:hypothetical protein
VLVFRCYFPATTTCFAFASSGRSELPNTNHSPPLQKRLDPSFFVLTIVRPAKRLVLESTAQLRRKGVSMRKHRDLKACISLLEEVQDRGSVDPVEYAVAELKLIRRRPDLSNTSYTNLFER